MPIQQMLVGVGKAEVFAEANGGTVTTVGDYKVHAFTSSGTFTVTQLADTNEFETLVVAGGGGPGNTFSAGGGGGGGIVNHQTGQALTAAAYTITVGGGGAGAGNSSGWPNTPTGNQGSDSSIKLASNSSIIQEADISDIASLSGITVSQPQANNKASWSSHAHFVGGNSAKVVNGTTTQYTGGGGFHSVGSAGGGAGAGENGDAYGSNTSQTYMSGLSWATGGGYSAGGGGGDGYATTMVTGSTTYYGGGGGAGTAANGASGVCGYNAPGGQGGGGNGANGHCSAASAGSTNTGGGGGGGHSNVFGLNAYNSANGGSGVVYIKYKYQ